MITLFHYSFAGDAQTLLCRFTHHPRMPRRLPDEIHGTMPNPRDALQCRFNPVDQTVTQGAAFGGQRHDYLNETVVGDVYFVNQPEIDHITIELRVDDLRQGSVDALLAGLALHVFHHLPQP